MLINVGILLIVISIPIGLGYFIGRKNREYKENEGEMKVRTILELLDGNEYHIKNNLTLPTQEGTTQIDHIVFSKKGVFVIETKDHKGWIYGSERQKQWTQTFNKFAKFKFYNPLLQNYGHVKQVEILTGIPGQFIRPIVVFANQDAKIKSELPSNVVNLSGLKEYIEGFSLNVITDEDVFRTIGKVEFYRRKRVVV